MKKHIPLLCGIVTAEPAVQLSQNSDAVGGWLAPLMVVVRTQTMNRHLAIIAFMLLANSGPGSESNTNVFAEFPKPLRDTASWSPFASIVRRNGGALVTFPDHGIRWAVRRNAESLGTSQYKQQILIRTNDVLVLNEEHTTAYARILSDGITNGLGIVLIGNPHYMAVVSNTNYFFHGMRSEPHHSADGSQPFSPVQSREPSAAGSHR
jgi:hypothetical protein